MKLEYPAVIKRDPDDPDRAVVTFPDFGEGMSDVIDWGDWETMRKKAAFCLGAVYATKTCFGGEPPKPSTIKQSYTAKKASGMVTCNYDLFCQHCLTVREIPL